MAYYFTLPRSKRVFWFSLGLLDKQLESVCGVREVIVCVIVVEEEEEVVVLILLKAESKSVKAESKKRENV